MQISAERVRQVAALARLGLRDDEVETLRRQLEAILGYVEQLAELDLAEVEPTTHVLPLDCPTREDRSRPGSPTESMVGLAPLRQGDYFAVPRVLPD